MQLSVLSLCHIVSAGDQQQHLHARSLVVMASSHQWSEPHA